jgi:AraC-like DNA-binding protein
LLVPALVAGAFEDLGISAASFSDGVWRAIHVVPNIGQVEIEHGSDQSRYRYNKRCLERARTTRRLVHGELFGLHDLFVPVVVGKRTRAVLAVGPFALSWPTASQVQERWQQMTRKRGRMSDPAFGRYLEATLSTLTLEKSLGSVFERAMQCFGRLVGGEGDFEALALECETLKQRLLDARYPDHMWEAARSMVDESTSHTWSTFLKADPLAAFGMKRPPRHAIVGLTVGNDRDDPVEQALARVAFQRAAVALARDRGGFVCGRLGDRGITVLPDLAERGARARAALTDMTTRVAGLARNFGFRFHAGIALESPGASIASRFRAALAAADKALSQGRAIELGGATVELTTGGLRQLRMDLAASIEGNPALVSPRFDRYVEAVLTHSGYRLEAARARLQAGLERLVEPLLSTGVLDAKRFDEICGGLETERGSDSIFELVREYRRVVSDVVHAIESPTLARQERSTRRALEFIQEHLAEPLTRARVARIAGLAPGHFSRVLRREEGQSFEHYVQKQRLERAKHLLRGTRLDVGRVAQRSGFRSRTSFQRLFKAAAGATPIEYRRG